VQGAAAGVMLALLAPSRGWSQPLPPIAEDDRDTATVPPPPPTPTSEQPGAVPPPPPASAPASQPTGSSQEAPPPASGEQPTVIALGPPGPIDVTVPEPPPPESRKYWQRRGTVFVPRFSVGLFGDGDLTFDGTCHGECPVAVTDGKVNATDKTRVGVGAEIIQSFRSPIRFGFGFHYVPRITIQPDELIDEDEDEEKGLGASFELPLILEGVIPTSDTLGLAVRGMFGPAVFFPGGAWQKDNQAYAEFCDEQSGADKCQVRRFMRGAWTYGLGGGPVFVVGPSTALRADVVFQFTNVKLFKFRAEDRDWDARQEYRFDGYRLWIMLGLEVM